MQFLMRKKAHYNGRQKEVTISNLGISVQSTGSVHKEEELTE